MNNFLYQMIITRYKTERFDYVLLCHRRRSFMTFVSLQWFYSDLVFNYACNWTSHFKSFILFALSLLHLRFQIRRGRSWCHLFWLKIVFALRDMWVQSHWKKQSITSRRAWGNIGITVSLFLLRRDYLLY